MLFRSDVTGFKEPGEQKKLYLSAILGLYGRYPVAYVASARNDNRLVFETFDRTVAAFKITDEASLGYAIKDYLRFYSEERPQGRYHCKTPLEVRLISHSLTRQGRHPRFSGRLENWEQGDGICPDLLQGSRSGSD